MPQESLTKEDVIQKLDAAEYTLKKQDVTHTQVDDSLVSATWLFTWEIYALPVGRDITSDDKPLSEWVCFDEGEVKAVLCKNRCTSNIRNFIGKCESIPLELRKKYFEKEVSRNGSPKRK